MTLKSTKLKIATLILALAGVVGISSLNVSPTFAADSVCDMPKKDVPQAVWDAAGCDKNNTDALPNIIINILNAIIAVAGLVAVIFVVIGGFNYMTSTGDPGKTKKAKDTILYAVIGLIICVLAFAIVNFVIKNILNSSSASSDDATPDATSLIIPQKDIAFLEKKL